jgi:hypothetical protein
MTNAHEPSQADVPGEQWTLAEAPQIQELFRLLAIPPMPGYTPVAMTAVGLAMSPTGEVAHYPVYAQLFGAEVSETAEVCDAIAILQGWLRAQQQRFGPGGGTQWPRAFGGH